MILHHFCRRSSKITLFWLKKLLFYQKSKKYFKSLKKYPKFLGFLGTPVEILVETPVGPLWRPVASLATDLTNQPINIQEQTFSYTLHVLLEKQAKRYT